MNTIIVTIFILIKKPIDAEYYALTENIKAIFKALKFKVGDRERIFKYNNVFKKGYTEEMITRNIFD